MSVLRPRRITERNLAYSVDRSWGNVKTDLDGHMYPSDSRKWHRSRPDGDPLAGTAVCSGRILLNDDYPGEDPTSISRDELCRRCFR